jgi:hypothetical protein
MQERLTITTGSKVIEKLFFILILGILNCISSYGQSKKLTVKTGIYEDAVVLAYDSVSSEISGFTTMAEHDDQNKSKVVRSCYLLFKGKYTGDEKCHVDIFAGSDPERIATGFVSIANNKLTLTTNTEISYCEDFLNLTSGETFPFKEHKPYIFCKSISKNKTYIYSTPADSAITKMYLIKNDYVAALKFSGQWIFVEYLGKKIIRGWIKNEDLFPSVIKK